MSIVRTSRIVVAEMLVAVFSSAFGQSSAPPNSTASVAESDPAVKIGFTQTQPKIDGVIDADEWKAAAKVELTYQVYPLQDDTTASEKTTVYLVYDSEHLYIAFHAFDSEPGAIRAPFG